MELEDLYSFAEETSIEVINSRLPLTKCFSLMDADLDCCVVIDAEQFETRASEKVALAHDVGHCVTGSFYNRYTPFDSRARHELRANRKATYMLIPIEELIYALDNPWNSIYDLAEYFGVTEDFMRKSLEIYRQDLAEIG